MPVSYVSRGGNWNERQNLLFRVANDKLVTVDADGIAANLGTIAGNGQASMPYSFNTQAVIAGGNYYLYDATNGFRQVTDPDVGTPIDGVWLSSYYVFTDGAYLYCTEIADESAINPADFATSEISPDPTIGLGTTADNKLLAFNRYTTDYFQVTLPAPSEGFPFSIIPARSVNSGIVGTHAKVRIDFPTQFGSGTWFCLGGGKDAETTVYAMSTGSTLPIASRTVNKIINSYNDSQLAEAYLESRNYFEYTELLVHLPNEVLLFNFKVAESFGVEKAWSVLNSSADGDTPYRAINGVYDPRRAQWTYGDKYSNITTYLDPKSSLHAGEMVECSIYTPFVYLETASIDELMIQTIPGYTSNSDATVFYSISYNGTTFSMEQTMQYGLPSAYNQRFIARRLGYVRNYFAMRFRWVSRSRMAFAMATINYS